MIWLYIIIFWSSLNISQLEHFFSFAKEVEQDIKEFVAEHKGKLLL